MAELEPIRAALADLSTAELTVLSRGAANMMRPRVARDLPRVAAWFHALSMMFEDEAQRRHGVLAALQADLDEDDGAGALVSEAVRDIEDLP